MKKNAHSKKSPNAFNERKQARLEELLLKEEKYPKDLMTISSMFDEIKKSSHDSEYRVKMPQELKVLLTDLLSNFDEIYNFHATDFTEDLRNSIFSAEKIRDLFQDKINKMKRIYGW